MDIYLQQYLDTAVWADRPEGDDWTEAEWSHEALESAAADVARFQKMAGDMIYNHRDKTMWCHDFWLTRQGHGAGFWDGAWPVWGDALTEISKTFGETWLYLGDDGKLYFG